MKRFLASALVVAAGGVMSYAQVAAPPAPVIQIELYDGSRLGGPALDRGVQFASSLGENVVPWEQIAGVVLNKDAGTSFDPADAGDSLELAKGGRLNGSVKSATVGVSTVLGKARLPLGKIKSIVCISSGGDGMASGAGASPMSTGLKSGLVLYFPFDKESRGAIKDESGLGNDGRIIGARFVADGVYGGAMAFGGSDYILIPGSPDLCPQEITISAWIRPASDLADESHVVLSKESGSAGYWIGFRPGSSAKPAMGFGLIGANRNGMYSFARSGKKFRRDTWYHLAGVFNGKKQRFFVNGELEETIDRGGGIGTSSQPLIIGSQTIPRSWGWQGDLDDVRVYNRALSDMEIRQLSMRASPVLSAAGTQPGTTPAASTFGIEVGLADQSVVKGTVNWTALPLLHAALGTLAIPWILIDSVIADAGNSTVTLRSGDVLVGQMQFEKANIDSALGRVAISRDQVRSIRVAQPEADANAPPARTGIAPNPAGVGTAPIIPRTRSVRDDGATKF